MTDGCSTLVHGADGAYSEQLISHAAEADLLLLKATYLNAGPELARDGHMNASGSPATSSSWRRGPCT